MEEEMEAIEIPIDGTLDLHAFRPADIKHLVPEYLEQCRRRDILQIRIIHGKGMGNLMRTVHALLDRLDFVVAFRLGDESSGSWGATLVTLRAKEQAASAQPGRFPPPGRGPES